MLLPAGVMAQLLFDGDAARLLLLGNAMHADAPIDAPGSGVMGYLLIMMAQDGGFPVPVGGAGQLTARSYTAPAPPARESTASARSVASM
jgi:phytoene dehydrogenase-like protein